MAKGLHVKPAGATYFAEDYNESYSFILDNMLAIGIDTGSFTNQEDAQFDLFATDTAGSTSGMTYGAGSYICDNPGDLTCTLATSVLPVNFSTAGSEQISHWTFDTCHLGSDVIGSNHGTLTNVALGSGKIGSSYVFNGSSSLINFGSDSTLTTNDFTVTGWIMPFDRSAGSLEDITSTIAGTNGGAGSVGGFELHIDSNGSFHGLINNGAKVDLDSGLNVPLDTWSFVSFTYDTSGSMITYVNGSLGSDTVATSFTHNGSEFIAGRRYIGSDFLNAKLDELAIWPRALTQAELQFIYNGSKATRFYDYQGSVTSAIVRGDTTLDSGVTKTVGISLDNGTTFTTVAEGQLGSITPSTGSLMIKFTFTRTTGSEDASISAYGTYYG